MEHQIQRLLKVVETIPQGTYEGNFRGENIVININGQEYELTPAPKAQKVPSSIKFLVTVRNDSNGKSKVTYNI